MKLVFIENNRPVTDSLTVAETFGKRHADVMRDIEVQLAKLKEASMEDWGLRNFAHTQYQHEQNGQWYFKYNMTEEAFAIVAMAYVTPEAMAMKVKFLEEFKRLREQSAKPQTQLEILQASIAQLVEQERRVNVLEAKVSEATGVINTIQETFLQRDEDWRKSMNSMLNAAAYRSGGNYRDLRADSYKVLEERGKCDLDKRLRNLKDRLSESGATKTKISETTRMDVIEADARLKEIYSTIVKEISIGTLKIAQ